MKRGLTDCITLTFLLLPQVLHDGESERGAGHQRGQDAQHDAHHVVVAHPHHRAHVVDLSVDGDLEQPGGGRTVSVVLVMIGVTSEELQSECAIHFGQPVLHRNSLGGRF